MSFSSSPFEAPDGTQGAVVVFEDKSERETLESQLRQAQKMEAVGQLTGGIAHDFNNLLTVILLHAEAMESFLTPADSGLRSSLKDIQEAAERAAVMTRKLLGFSRRAPLKPVPLDVVKVARGMASMIRRVLPETIEFSLAAHGDVAPIKGDAGAVEQILLNLATNARDAMRSGGQLNIDVREVELSLAFADEHPWANPGPHVKISVQDSGTGMDQHTLEKVFDPFFTTKEVGEGTGLGLAMVYGLMKQQGGFVQAESEVGVGTTISLYFPELPSIASIQEKEMEEELEFAGNETILVVEDDRSLRQVASETLARNGYKVVEAGNGEEAMALLLSRRKEINLVLTDIVMPRMGGIALHEKTREMGLNVPFLFTSGYLGGAGGGATLPENGPPFVAKPWNKRTLLRSLRRLLDRDGLGEWAREGSCDC